METWQRWCIWLTSILGEYITAVNSICIQFFSSSVNMLWFNLILHLTFIFLCVQCNIVHDQPKVRENRMQTKDKNWTSTNTSFSKYGIIFDWVFYYTLLYRHKCFTGKYSTRKIHKNYIRDPSGLFSIISHVGLSMT